MLFKKWQVLGDKLLFSDISGLRHMGQTTYLINATIWQPDVIVICENHRQIEQLKVLRELLMKKVPWYLRLFVNKRKKPMYSTLEDRFKLVGVHKPVVFDITPGLVSQLHKRMVNICK